MLTRKAVEEVRDDWGLLGNRKPGWVHGDESLKAEIDNLKLELQKKSFHFWKTFFTAVLATIIVNAALIYLFLNM